MTKTKSEQIESIRTEIAQLENKRKRLLQEQKKQERKARTKRLIERGAILESLLNGADRLTNEQIKTFLEKTITGDYAGKILAGLTEQGG